MRISPSGKVPVIQYEDKTIYDSLSILRYIEKVGVGVTAVDEEVKALAFDRLNSLHELLGKSFGDVSELDFMNNVDAVIAGVNAMDSLADAHPLTLTKSVVQYSFSPLVFVTILIANIAGRDILPVFRKSEFGSFLIDSVQSNSFRKTVVESYVRDVVNFFGKRDGSFLAKVSGDVDEVCLQEVVNSGFRLAHK